MEWLSAAAIDERYQIKTYGGILSAKAASMDAYQFTHELILKLLRNEPDPLLELYRFGR